MLPVWLSPCPDLIVAARQQGKRGVIQIGTIQTNLDKTLFAVQLWGHYPMSARPQNGSGKGFLSRLNLNSFS